MYLRRLKKILRMYFNYIIKREDKYEERRKHNRNKRFMQGIQDVSQKKR